MAIANTVNEVLQRMKVKLYPNYLPNAEGRYIARTESQACLSIEDVCASMKNRGGYAGSHEFAVNTVKHYFNEAGYQLCNGNTVNTGLFSIQPNICGTFSSAAEARTIKKEVDFRYRTLAPLRKLVQDITVDITGVADTFGYIEEFTDVATGAVNETVTHCGQFVITGYKIKLAGEDSNVGVYFVAADGSGRTIRVTENFAENSASKLIGIIPCQVDTGAWKVVIKTQFSNGSNLLKELRIIESGFRLSV